MPGGCGVTRATNEAVDADTNGREHDDSDNGEDDDQAAA
jgi:hypothetical protein